jgi:hypothetical protein
MKRAAEVSVTLTPELYKLLSAESRELGVPLEWIVASLVVDTIESDTPEPALV